MFFLLSFSAFRLLRWIGVSNHFRQEARHTGSLRAARISCDQRVNISVDMIEVTAQELQLDTAYGRHA